MEKVKLTKEQRAAIKTLNGSMKTSEIVCAHAHGWGASHRGLKDVSLDTLIRALYIGFEVEETPEERIKSAYDKRINDSSSTHCEITSANKVGFADGIKFTLNELSIKIEGVNA